MVTIDWRVSVYESTLSQIRCSYKPQFMSPLVHVYFLHPWGCIWQVNSCRWDCCWVMKEMQASFLFFFFLSILVDCLLCHLLIDRIYEHRPRNKWWLCILLFFHLSYHQRCGFWPARIILNTILHFLHYFWNWWDRIFFHGYSPL